MKVAVLGGGHGGHAMAADLALAGNEINFYEAPEFGSGIAQVIETNEIEIKGVVRTGVAKLNLATTNMKEAVEGMEVINVVTPAFAHEIFYERLLPHLEDGQIVISHTGNYGTLQLAHMMESKGIKKDVTIGETQILVYTCRRTGPGSVMVNGYKSHVTFATLPANKTKKTIERVKDLFPTLVPGTNVLETSLDNLNFVLHTPIMVFNAGRVEDPESEFLFYIQGASPSVARVHEALDAERMAVKKALGFNVLTLREWLIKTYDSKGVNIYEAIQNTIPYHDKTCETAPSSMTHRYLEEDLPFGVVPFTSIAKLVDIPTPTADTIVHLASLMNNKNYKKEGLNATKMGLNGKTPEQLKTILDSTR